jgi:hypothetical protein
MAGKFHERFDLKIDLQAAQHRFLNRLHNCLLDKIDSRQQRGDKGLIEFILTGIGQRTPRLPRWNLSNELGMDFYKNLEALEHLYRAPGIDKRVLDALIIQLLTESELDLGVRWQNGKFVKSGAVLLDESLVNDPLRWLRERGYEPVLTPFEKGMNHYLYATKRPELLADVVTDMYESLEALAKIVIGRSEKDLSANREVFLAKVKASDEYKQLLKVYIDYANRFRHAEREGQPRPELSIKEVESFIYLTGVFIRLVMPSAV